MASVAQKPLFGWQQIEGLGDLVRLKLVLDNLPTSWRGSASTRMAAVTKGPLFQPTAVYAKRGRSGGPADET